MNNRERDVLIHYGILGQKWGVRRYQNEDGTLTEAGRERYGYGDGRKDGVTFEKAVVSVKKDARTQRFEEAQKHGETALRKYKKLDDEYDLKIATAIKKEDWSEVEKLENEFRDISYREVFKPLYDAGYEWVDEGRYISNDEHVISLQYGKFLEDDVDDFIDEFIIDTKNYIAWRT